VQASGERTISGTRLGGALLTLLRQLTLPEGDHLRAIEEHDLTISQVRSLLVLSCAEEPLPGGRIAERLGISPAAISRALDGLVRQGLVERCEPSAEDRRIRPFAITAAGRTVADEVTALKRAQLERFVASLDERQRGLWEAAIDGLGSADGAEESP
jgi:DNA-binding MarR family transcriptional regulator